jgi:hypothetical protein
LASIQIERYQILPQIEFFKWQDFVQEQDNFEKWNLYSLMYLGHDNVVEEAILAPSHKRQEAMMKSPVIVISLASLSLTVAAQGSVSAAQKQQRPPTRYTVLQADRTTPTAPIRPVAVRSSSFEDGTGVAIRLQDAHHGEGGL